MESGNQTPDQLSLENANYGGSESLSLVSSFATEGAAKLGEHAVDIVFQYVLEFFGSAFMGTISRKLGLCFRRYLENAAKRYNHIKTPATGAKPRLIIGENALYYKIDVSLNGQPISTQCH